jgi:Flp pilus assembly protein TadG
MSTMFEWIISKTRQYRTEARGAAAVEFALTISLLIVPLLNVADAAFYVYNRMALDNAAQAGAAAALVACGTSSKLPATTGSCPELVPAVKAAAQSTWLGTAVGTPTINEYFYCSQTSSNTLVQVGNVAANTKPASCVNNGGSVNDVPGDYVQVSLSYSFNSIFPGLSIVGGMSPIVRTAYMRLD